jgi:hypothetical protein
VGLLAGACKAGHADGRGAYHGLNLLLVRALLQRVLEVILRRDVGGVVLVDLLTARQRGELHHHQQLRAVPSCMRSLRRWPCCRPSSFACCTSAQSFAVVPQWLRATAVRSMLAVLCVGGLLRGRDGGRGGENRSAAEQGGGGGSRAGRKACRAPVGGFEDSGALRNVDAFCGSMSRCLLENSGPRALGGAR